MPTEAKQAAVAELKEALSASNATIVADYRGLTVSDIQAVRRALRNDGITYRVVKNRLAKIAATEAGREELNDLLDGPTGLAMGASDEVTLARVFLDAIRPYKTIVVRGGVVGAARIDADSITRLSLLPTREVLLAQLAGGMASPLSTMASLFAAPLRNLGYALSQLADKKGEEAPATAVPAAPETPATEAAAPEVEATAEATAEAADAEEVAEAAPADEASAIEASADSSAEVDSSAKPESESAADDNQSESESA